MGFVFADIVVGGVVLVRDAIQSSNFVSGSSGWQVKSDGSAEFNNITVRGSFHSGDGSGVNTDVNSTNGFFVSFGGSSQPTYVQIIASATTGTINFQPISGGTWISNPGALEASVLNAGSSFEQGRLVISSPATNNKNQSVITMLGQASDSSIAASISISGNITASSGNFTMSLGNITLTNGLLTVNGSGVSTINDQLTVNGLIRGKTLVASNGGIVASSAVLAAAGAETVVMTASSFAYEPFRAYRVEVVGNAQIATTASQPLLFRIRKTNAVGQQLRTARFNGTAVSQAFDIGHDGIFKCTSSVTAVLVTTLTPSATASAQLVASATDPCFFNVFDIGTSADYPNAPTLV